MTRSDGVPLDAWQRVHVRRGATPAGVAEGWPTATAPVGNWERRTGLVFPEAGR